MRRVIPLVALILILAVVGVALAAPSFFLAHLRGASEVPPVDTRAQGQTILQLNRQGDALSYRLIVANIEDVVQAHIHCGAEGMNGPVVAFLFGPAQEAVSLSGILAQGTITADNVIPRESSAACPGGVADFEDLIEKMETGNAYVNVHTVENPGGEIRGQVQFLAGS